MKKERAEEEKGSGRQEGDDRNEEHREKKKKNYSHTHKHTHKHAYTHIHKMRGQTKWLKGCLDNALDRDGTQSSYTW